VYSDCESGLADEATQVHFDASRTESVRPPTLSGSSPAIKHERMVCGTQYGVKDKPVGSVAMLSEPTTA